MELVPQSTKDTVVHPPKRNGFDRYLLSPVVDAKSALIAFAMLCLCWAMFSVGTEYLFNWRLADKLQLFLILPLFYAALCFSTRIYVYMLPMTLFSAIVSIVYMVANPTENIFTALSMWLVSGLSCELIFRIARHERTLQAEKAVMAHQLQESLDTIKRLSEILPICKVCDELRTDEAGWKEFEQFLNTELSVEIVKGVCPSCVKKMVDEIQFEDKNMSA